MVTAETWQPVMQMRAHDGEVDIQRDRQLVERAQHGDTEAFDALYECYLPRLERYCLRRLNDVHEAQDIAQEAFLRAWKALPNFGGDRRFYPWLSVIASNLCTDSLRRRQRFGPVPVAEPKVRELPASSSTEESVVAAVDLDLAARAFAQLSDRHQRILDLRERSGLSYQAIAEHEGIRVTTVETLIWRARRAFKREFCALDGSEGKLGGLGASLLGIGFLRRALGGIRTLKATRTVGAVSAKLAAVSSQGVLVAVGGAVATAAIVVASVSGAHHPQVTPRAIGSGPRTALPSGAVPTNASDDRALGTDVSGRATSSPPRANGAGSGSSQETSGATSRSPTTSSGATGASGTQSPGSETRKISQPISVTTGSHGAGGNGGAGIAPPNPLKGVHRTAQTVANEVQRLVGKTGAVQHAVQQVVSNAEQAVGGVEQAVGGVEQAVGGTVEQAVGGVERSIGGVPHVVGSTGRSVGNAARPTVQNLEQTLSNAERLANAHSETAAVQTQAATSAGTVGGDASRQVQAAVSSAAEQLAKALG